MRDAGIPTLVVQEMNEARTSSVGVPSRRLRPWVTVLLAVILLHLVIWLRMDTLQDRLSFLTYPAESGIRVLERDLDLASAIERGTVWERFLLSLGQTTEGQRRYARAGLREVLRHLESNKSQAAENLVGPVRAHLIIMVAESGLLDEAAAEMSHLGDSIEGMEFAAAVRHAYAVGTGDSPLSPGLDGALTLLSPKRAPKLSPEWAADRLAFRYYTRMGSAAEAARVLRRYEERGDRLRKSYLGFLALMLIPASGLVLLMVLFLHREPLKVAGGAVQAAPWRLATGLAVVVRSAFWAVILMIVVAVLTHASGSEDLLPWPTLLASLPMFWLMRRHILAPAGLRLRDAFGLRFAKQDVWQLAQITLILAGIEQFFSLISFVLASKSGWVPHWSESIVEDWIWKSRMTATMTGVDAVIWAPLLEEIGFRGLLYTSLRARLRPLAAAVATASLFASIHSFYSVSGWIAIFLGAVAASLVYEKCRSLLPCILAHALNNVLAFASVVAVYR